MIASFGWRGRRGRYRSGETGRSWETPPSNLRRRLTNGPASRRPFCESNRNDTGGRELIERGCTGSAEADRFASPLKTLPRAIRSVRRGGSGRPSTPIHRLYGASSDSHPHAKRLPFSRPETRHQISRVTGEGSALHGRLHLPPILIEERHRSCPFAHPSPRLRSCAALALNRKIRPAVVVETVPTAGC